jgi:uroporphyrinogen decarboxylase
MNPRERFIVTLQFGKPDKVPFSPGWPRKSTLDAWHAQGRPQDGNWFDVLCREVGIVQEATRPRVHHGVDFRMIPQFEEKILEHRDGHYVVQDWKGNVCEISDRFDPVYLRNAIDFVTRKWIKLPVESRADWEMMKARYDPDGPGRFPDDFADRCRRLRERDYVCTVAVNGPFWQMREWLGFERLCILFIDDPDLLREMVEFWTEFVSRTLASLLDAGVVDHLHISEDMAFKQKPMISPAMAREFLQPCYRRWVGEARQAAVPIIDMDSDGKVHELIPVWIESDINVCDPMEVAAGNDIGALRATHGRRMAFRGGVDKRAIASGGEVIVEELERLAPVVRDGGYIPECDHGVPPDISWPDFVRYSRMLAELTGWL